MEVAFAGDSQSKPPKNEILVRRVICRYGPGCTHMLDPAHREKFWHPNTAKLSEKELNSGHICNECGYATSSLSDLQLHLQRKTAWSNTSLVGCRISCLVDYKEWHEGYVTQYHKSGKHFVEFRMVNEKRWLVMKKIAFYIVERPLAIQNDCGSEFKDDSEPEGLAPIEDDWVFVEDISLDYGYAQSMLFKLYGSKIQETGHLTKGHVCLTDSDRTNAQYIKGSLLYGELLPRGANKAFGSTRLNAGNASVLFDLGMGTGKIAIQAFLQFKKLRYVYGVELSIGRYKVAEEAALKMVKLLGREKYHVSVHPGKYIIITERSRSSRTAKEKEKDQQQQGIVGNDEGEEDKNNVDHTLDSWREKPEVIEEGGPMDGYNHSSSAEGTAGRGDTGTDEDNDKGDRNTNAGIEGRRVDPGSSITTGEEGREGEKGSMVQSGSEVSLIPDVVVPDGREVQREKDSRALSELVDCPDTAGPIQASSSDCAKGEGKACARNGEQLGGEAESQALSDDDDDEKSAKGSASVSGSVSVSPTVSGAGTPLDRSPRDNPRRGSPRETEAGEGRNAPSSSSSSVKKKSRSRSKSPNGGSSGSSSSRRRTLGDPGAYKGSERVLHLVCGNMFDTPSIGSADVVMMETDVPVELGGELKTLLSGLHEGARILTYLDLRRMWDDELLPFQQLECNRNLSDRYPTSWSVQRGHHFYLWTKMSWTAMEAAHAAAQQAAASSPTSTWTSSVAMGLGSLGMIGSGGGGGNGNAASAASAAEMEYQQSGRGGFRQQGHHAHLHLGHGSPHSPSAGHRGGNLSLGTGGNAGGGGVSGNGKGSGRDREGGRRRGPQMNDAEHQQMGKCLSFSLGYLFGGGGGGSSSNGNGHGDGTVANSSGSGSNNSSSSHRNAAKRNTSSKNKNNNNSSSSSDMNSNNESTAAAHTVSGDSEGAQHGADKKKNNRKHRASNEHDSNNDRAIIPLNSDGSRVVAVTVSSSVGSFPAVSGSTLPVVDGGSNDNGGTIFAKNDAKEKVVGAGQLLGSREVQGWGSSSVKRGDSYPNTLDGGTAAEIDDLDLVQDRSFVEGQQAANGTTAASSSPLTIRNGLKGTSLIHHYPYPQPTAPGSPLDISEASNGKGNGNGNGSDTELEEIAAASSAVQKMTLRPGTGGSNGSKGSKGSNGSAGSRAGSRSGQQSATGLVLAAPDVSVSSPVSPRTPYPGDSSDDGGGEDGDCVHDGVAGSPGSIAAARRRSRAEENMLPSADSPSTSAFVQEQQTHSIRRESPLVYPPTGELSAAGVSSSSASSVAPMSRSPTRPTQGSPRHSPRCSPTGEGGRNTGIHKSKSNENNATQSEHGGKSSSNNKNISKSSSNSSSDSDAGRDRAYRPSHHQPPMQPPVQRQQSAVGKLSPRSKRATAAGASKDSSAGGAGNGKGANKDDANCAVS